MLERFNKNSIVLYESFIRYVLDLRSMFDIYEERAINITGYKTYRKIRKRKFVANGKKRRRNTFSKLEILLRLITIMLLLTNYILNQK